MPGGRDWRRCGTSSASNEATRHGRTQASNVEAEEARAPHALQSDAAHAPALPAVRQPEAATSRVPQLRVLQGRAGRDGRGRVIRIALDAMGGDNAPRVEVEGVAMALRELPGDFRIQLVGRQADINAALAQAPGLDRARVEVVDAPDVVGMGEKPLNAIRSKPQSSIMVGLGLQKRSEPDAFISAGNTGAVMAAATLVLRLHEGVQRAAIGAVLPTARQPVLMLDAGANVDCDARELVG